VTASGHQVHRSADLVAKADHHYFKLHLQLEGHGFLVQDRREAMLSAGDLAVYDTSRPYSLAEESDHSAVVLMFPHEAIHLPADWLKELTAVRFDGAGGLARLVSPFIERLVEDLGVLAGAGGRRLATTAVDLVTTMFETELDRTRTSRDDPHRQLMLAVHEFIEDHLGDPGLSPTVIADANFVSTRLLHKLFEDTGVTVSGWIRTRRLECCRRDLRDPLCERESVTAIAARWGFTDAAHFSRLFRATFGEPPSQYRRS